MCTLEEEPNPNMTKKKKKEKRKIENMRIGISYSDLIASTKKRLKAFIPTRQRMDFSNHRLSSARKQALDRSGSL